MKYLLKKDKSNRKSYKLLENKRKVYKALVSNDFLDVGRKELVKDKMSNIGFKFTRVVNRCIFTGRKRGILREFKISRYNFKELAQKGYLEGVKKSSW